MISKLQEFEVGLEGRNKRKLVVDIEIGYIWSDCIPIRRWAGDRRAWRTVYCIVGGFDVIHIASSGETPYPFHTSDLPHGQ